MCQYVPTLLFKNAPNLSDCKTLFCGEPFLDHPTDVGSHSCFWPILKPCSSSGNTILYWFWWVLWVITMLMKLLFIFNFLAEASKFCADSDWNLEPFRIPSTFTKSPVPTDEKQPQSMRCCFVDERCCVCTKLQSRFHQTIACAWKISSVLLENVAGARVSLYRISLPFLPKHKEAES